MFRKLPPSLFAVALSGVIALGAMTASAGPARADSRDAARILGGVIALYAIGRPSNSATMVVRRGKRHMCR